MKRKSLRRKMHTFLHQLPSCPDTAFNAINDMLHQLISAIMPAPKKTRRRRKSSIA